LSNPYRISEVDFGVAGELPVSITAIDQEFLTDGSGQRFAVFQERASYLEIITGT
jgi:hypothetical protein